jgi:hypothetical protein
VRGLTESDYLHAKVHFEEINEDPNMAFRWNEEEGTWEAWIVDYFAPSSFLVIAQKNNWEPEYD